MTSEQVDRLLGLLDHIENLAIYDEKVTDVIMTKSEVFFAGRRNAEKL